MRKADTLSALWVNQLNFGSVKDCRYAVLGVEVRGEMPPTYYIICATLQSTHSEDLLKFPDATTLARDY